MSGLRKLALLSLIASVSLASAEEIAIPHWLQLGPLPVYKAAFADSLDSPAKLLERQFLDLPEYRPREGDRLDWSPGITERWRARLADTLSWSTIDAPASIAYAASYLTTDRWRKLKIKASASRPLALFINGKQEGSSSSADDEGNYVLTVDYPAHSGKHVLVFKSIGSADQDSVWILNAAVETEGDLEPSMSWSLDPQRTLTHYKDYALFGGLKTPQLSPNGKWVAVLRSEREHDGEYQKRTWIEVFETASGKPVETIRMATSPGNLAFLPDNNRLSFTTSKEGKTTLWTYDLVKKEMTVLLDGIEGFMRAEISPDMKYVYYVVNEKEEEDDSGYQLYQGLEDQVYTYVRTHRLYVKSLREGATHPLTQTGEYALENWELSPDGGQLLLIRRIPMETRPYSKFEFWVYDLEKDKNRLIETRANIEFPSGLTWVGRNSVAYALGSHDASVEDTVFYNAGNSDLFLLDFDAGISRNLTAGTLFSVADPRGHRRVYWNPSDKMIWFHALRGGHRRMMKVSPRGGELIDAVRTDFDFMDKPVLSADGSVIAYTASDYKTPEALYVQKTRSKSEKLILNPSREAAEELTFGGMTEWDFVNEDGITIDGWLYYPAGFDPDNRYPLIVYYYGGVSPRDVRFTFTYQWWLANGYCVYVLNPVGAYGYGQDFADKHANDWGRLATRDVIEGTTKLLEEKPYYDRERVGAYGGSYGGFITLDLVTRTDMFKTAIDMYGISNITSYFGGGTWGHWYCDIASPGSFPWSNPEIYIDRSPVFSADKVTTPLLILHGGGDVNVPPIESSQMFKALKILGQEVVFVSFDDETHNINTKFKNLIEHREMMLEWFDKYLKDQPEAWENRIQNE